MTKAGSSQDSIRRAYDTVAKDYAAYLPDTRAESILDLAMIQVFAEFTEGGPVLDAGCGAGRMSRHLAGRGCAVQGVDLSPAMIDLALSHHPDLRFDVGSLTELPYVDAQFAGVMLWYSIIHTKREGLAPVLREAARVLKPGGHVLVGFQAGEGARDLAEAYRRFGHEVELERYRHAPEEVIDILTAIGFSVRAQLLRRPEDDEQDDQASVLAQLT